MSPDPDKTGGAADEQVTEEWTAERAEAEARGAELREELAITDERRAEEEEAEAEAAVAAAEKEESKKERKRREAEEQRAAAAAEAERARERAARTAETAGPAPKPAPEPVALMQAPDRPELLIAGAFAGAFLFARILKKITD